MFFQSEEVLEGLPFTATTCHVDCNYCVATTWTAAVYYNHMLLVSWIAIVTVGYCCQFVVVVVESVAATKSVVATTLTIGSYHRELLLLL